MPPHSETNLEKNFEEFLDLSTSLLHLIEHENSILAEMGSLNFETYIEKKVAMMRNFEKQAQNLLLGLTGAEHTGKNNAKGRVLMSEIERIKKALTINSAYQMETIKGRTKARREKFAAPQHQNLNGASALH